MQHLNFPYDIVLLDTNEEAMKKTTTNVKHEAAKAELRISQKKTEVITTERGVSNDDA